MRPIGVDLGVSGRRAPAIPGKRDARRPPLPYVIDSGTEPRSIPETPPYGRDAAPFPHEGPDMLEDPKALENLKADFSAAADLIGGAPMSAVVIATVAGAKIPISMAETGDRGASGAGMTARAFAALWPVQAINVFIPIQNDQDRQAPDLVILSTEAGRTVASARGIDGDGPRHVTAETIQHLAEIAGPVHFDPTQTLGSQAAGEVRQLMEQMLPARVIADLDARAMAGKALH